MSPSLTLDVFDLLFSNGTVSYIKQKTSKTELLMFYDFLPIYKGNVDILHVIYINNNLTNMNRTKKTQKGLNKANCDARTSQTSTEQSKTSKEQNQISNQKQNVCKLTDATSSLVAALTSLSVSPLERYGPCLDLIKIGPPLKAFFLFLGDVLGLTMVE